MVNNISHINGKIESMRESLQEMNLSDFDLWKKFKEGNVQAYSVIYSKYVKVLYNYSKNICKDEELVKDCIQDLYIELWKNKENLGATDSIKYYLYKSIRRKIVYELNRNKNKYELGIQEEDEVELVVPHELNLITDQITKENKDNLKKAIDLLSSRQREIILLLFYDNMKYQEVAAIMSINLRSVYTLAWKALEALKQHFKKSTFFLFAVSSIGYFCKVYIDIQVN